jgi:hypothetical protein
VSDVQVVDPTDGSLRDVTADRANAEFRTGALRLPSTADVALVGPDGVSSMFPAKNVPDAVANGFSFAGSTDKAKMRALESPLLAGAEAFADSLSPIPGAVHGIEIALGVDPADIAARAETMPAQIGNVGGIVGGLALGGLGAASKGALSALIPGVAGNLLARGAAEAAEKTVGRYVESEIARKALTAGLGRALEGATYGVAHVADEAALGNVDANAETLIAAAGAGGLLGGALGAVGGAAGPAARKAAEAVSRQGRKGLVKYAAGLVGGAVGGMPGAIGASVLAGRAYDHAGVRDFINRAATGIADVGRKTGKAVVASNPRAASIAGEMLSEGRDAVLGGGAAAAGLSAIQSVIKRTDDYIASRAARIAGQTMPFMTRPVAASVVRTTMSMLDGDDKTRRNAYDERSRELAALSDPAVMGAAADREMSPLAADAPQTASAVVMQAQRALDYLRSHIPPAQPGTAGGVSAMFRGKRDGAETAGRPSDRAIRDFAALDRLVQDPLYALDLVEKGTIRPTHVEALRELYPTLHQRLTALVSMGLTQRTKDVSAATQRGVLTFLGATPSAFAQHARASVFAPKEPVGASGRGMAAPPSIAAVDSPLLTPSQGLEYR